MKHLSSPELAAKYLGKESEYEQVVSVLNQLPENVRKPQLALYKLSVLSEASWKKEKKHLDWTNGKKKKYYPWFDLTPGSASGFSYYYRTFVYGSSNSTVGSRLVFPTKEAVFFMGKTHLELYKDLMTLDQ